MTGSVNKISDWKRRLGSQLQRDKKRTALLVVLLVAAGTIGGRLVVSKAFPVPTKAQAAPEDNGSERLLPDASMMGPFAPSSSKGLSALRPDAAARREEYLASLDRTITRDLFRPSPELFPPSGDNPGASRRSPARRGRPRKGHPGPGRCAGTPEHDGRAVHLGADQRPGAAKVGLDKRLPRQEHRLGQLRRHQGRRGRGAAHERMTCCPHEGALTW